MPEHTITIDGVCLLSFPSLLPLAPLHLFAKRHVTKLCNKSPSIGTEDENGALNEEGHRVQTKTIFVR